MGFKITRGAANTIICTLTERTTLASPNFLFRFRKSGVENTCISADLSTQTDRYNKFTITESTTEARTTGTLKLLPVGFWDYEIYEQTSSTNLAVANADNLTPLEKGICKVYDTTANTYVEPTQSDVFVEYGSGAN